MTIPSSKLYASLHSYYTLTNPSHLPLLPSLFPHILSKYNTPLGLRKLKSRLMRKYGVEFFVSGFDDYCGEGKDDDDDDNDEDGNEKRKNTNKPITVIPSSLPLPSTTTLNPSFTSPTFDATYSLLLQPSDLPILVLDSGECDSIEDARKLLPVEDEYRISRKNPSKRSRGIGKGGGEKLQPTRTSRRRRLSEKFSSYDDDKSYSSGERSHPLSMLSSSLSATHNLLSAAVSTRRPVIVKTRTLTGMGQDLIGRIIGFDKHFNLLFGGGRGRKGFMVRGDCVVCVRFK